MDPHETSLLDADVDAPPVQVDDTMIVDDDKSDVAPCDTDSAVGSDTRTGPDSSFQSGSSGLTSTDVVDASEVTDGDGAANDSSNSVASVPDVHECVSLISDAVHVQSAATVGVVDAKLVSDSLKIRFLSF